MEPAKEEAEPTRIQLYPTDNKRVPKFWAGARRCQRRPAPPWDDMS